MGNKNNMLFVLFGPWNNLLEMSPNGAGSFFPSNLDLADILGRTDLDLKHFHFFDFAESSNLASWAGPGLAWAKKRRSLENKTTRIRPRRHFEQQHIFIIFCF